MSHSFVISVNDDLSSTLKDVETAIVEKGGVFTGDASNGEFSGKTILGKIKGKYTCLADDEIEITITKKPFAVTKRKIESAVREYFA